MTTPDDLYPAILAAPHDDLPRLLFAEALEDRGGPGDAEYAEFIRVQVAIAKRSGCIWAGTPVRCPASVGKRLCEVCERQEGREAHLWGHGFGGLALEPPLRSLALHVVGSDIPGELPKGVVRRGFVDESRLPLAAYLGGVCGRCDGSGYGSIARATIPDALPAGWRCPDCSGTGRTPGLAAELCGRHPLQTVTLVDKQPLPNSHGRWGWLRQYQGNEGEPDRLPAALFDLLPGVAQSTTRVTAYYQNADDASSALSLACVNYGRKLAGLPPLALPTFPLQKVGG